MPTFTTKRQKIVDELKARLATIKTSASPLADGYQYQTNLGLNGGTSDSPNAIDEWPTQYDEQELTTASRVGIFDMVESRTKENRESQLTIAELPVQVRIFHKRGTTPAALRVMMSDVMRAVVTNRVTGREDIQLNNLAVDTSPGESGFIVPSDTFQVDGAAIGFTVHHVVKPFEA
jgi:hypothetical protein